MDFENNYKSYPLVLIIVPNKDGINHLSYSLDSISKIKYPNFRVVVVDNCSNDDSVKYVRKTYPEVEIIQNKTDAGFSGSVNRGLLHGLNINAEFLVVFSNDVRVHSQWLLSSVKALENRPECGIAGFLEISGTYYNSLLKMPSEIEIKRQAYPNCAAIYILRSKLIREVGLYDEGYYMYGEDNDFFYRCGGKGYLTLQTNIPVWHKGGGSSESISRQQMMTRYIYRNWLRFAVKNVNFRHLILTLIKMIAYAFLPNTFWKRKGVYRSVNRLVRFKLTYRIKCLIHAIFWNIANARSTKYVKCQEKKWIEKMQNKTMN
ncbi:glycosyltransferase [Candidatus Babeliales bacterium]|nr:glycosyltransferase [Candidatus Babeliales bacterium]